MPSWFTLFIVADVIVILAIAFLVVGHRVKLNMDFKVNTTGVDFRSLMEFTREKHARIGEYLRANWSGAPEQLPEVLETLLAELERDAQARGLAIDRDMLKSVLASSVRAHRIARPHDLGEAMKRVA